MHAGNDSFGGEGSPPTVAPAAKSVRFQRVALILTIIVVALVIVPIPQAPLRIGDDVDTSTSMVLNFAQEKGLQHGKDVVFTYGPLGFLTFFYYSPNHSGLRMAFDIVLASVVASGLCLLAWRMGVIWRWLFLAGVLWIGANAWYREDWVINCGILCWSILCFFESGGRLRVSAGILVALGVVLGLAKLSTLVLVGVGIFLIGCDLLLRGHLRLAVGMWLGFGVGFPLGWMLAGQSLANLPEFLHNSRSIVKGYNQAVGLDGLQAVRLSGLILILPWLATICIRACFAFARGPRCRLRGSLLLAWLLFIAFATWKHGWVRVDPFHVVMFLGFVVALALGLEALPGTNRWASIAARSFAVVSCFVAALTLQNYFFEAWPRPLVIPARALYEHVRWIAYPPGYRAEMEAARQKNLREASLPGVRDIVGNATVDVFGQPVGYALANDLNYHPRPVFQSYATFNAHLMHLNEQFYLSKAAPEFVLFSLGAMDKRLPAIEDSPLLRHLLINYRPVATVGDQVILKSASSDSARLSLLHDGAVVPGARIDLKSFGNTNLWLEVEMTPSLAGHLRHFLYRPSTVRLAVWRDNELLIRHRSPTSMVEGGFLASPLLARTEDVLELYTNGAVIRPTAYSIELPAEEKDHWEETIHYKIYSIANQLGTNSLVESRKTVRTF